MRISREKSSEYNSGLSVAFLGLMEVRPDYTVDAYFHIARSFWTKKLVGIEMVALLYRSLRNLKLKLK